MRNPYRKSFVSSGSIVRDVASAPVQASSLLKTMLLGAGLTLAAANPSIAQSYDPAFGSGNIAPAYGQTAQGGDTQNGWNEYAQIVPRVARGARKLDPRMGLGRSMSTWNAFDDQGSTGRTDPDPNIRFQLNRESLQGRW